MRHLVLLACATILCGVGARAQPDDDLSLFLSALASRTQHYYERFVSIICTETVETQNLTPGLKAIGRPRTTVYELSVSADSRETREHGFRVERLLQSVNGRPARKNERAECTDPKTGTPEPLAFLLASNQRRYRFAIGDARGGPAGTRAIAFMETPPERVRVKWEGGCFEAEGGGHQGRVWFDPATYDIVQVEVRLSKPFQIPVADGFFGIRPVIRVEKSETTLRYSPVAFQHPDERLMLPTSIETVHLLRGAASMRITQALGNYRRFLTKAEIRSSRF